MADRTCSVLGCGRPHHAHGYCAGHAAQVRRGAPLGPLKPRQRTLLERFEEKVVRGSDDDCWIWQGARNSLGYGQLWEGSRVNMAHRVSLTLAGVEIPDGYDIDHLCRTPSCVNPKHLEPVPHAVNMDRAPYAAPDFQSAKTHCPQGHEYTAENTKYKRNASGTLSRLCKACRLEEQRRRRARKRTL